MITKKLKLTSEQGLDATTFKLPESIACSDVKFPVIPRTSVRIKWADIVKEREEFGNECLKYENRQITAVPLSPFRRTESEYVNKLFVAVMPALIKTLEKAKIWECLVSQKCFFNGVDYIAEVLWNNNPRHPNRKSENLHIFNMPWVREYLKEHPRPLYPKSWLWPKEYAASLIQKTVRQYFVQREEEVQEMRDFWTKINAERDVPEIIMNPLLSKKFAESTLGPHNKSVIITPANKHEPTKKK